MAAHDRGDDAEPSRQGAPDTPPGADADATAPVEPASPPPPGEPSVSAPPVGPSGTSVLPPVPDGPPPAPEPPRWAARAQVPRPHIEDYPDEWAAEPPRGVLIPVLVTVAILVLVGVFGMGVWLLLDNRPQPVPTQPTTTTTTSSTTTTTTAPTTTTTSATPTGIRVPTLTGQEYEDAARTLAELGLEPEREDVFSDSVPEGQVIATNPTAGTRVSAGDTITVFVSSGPEPTAEPTDTPTDTPTPTAT